MAVHFVFSDEAGDYRKSPAQRFLRANPYLVRAGVIIKDEDWSMLRNAFGKVHSDYRLPTDCELKWSYIGSIMAHRRRGEVIPADREYSKFGVYPNEQLLGFVRDTVGLLRLCQHCRVIYTVTDNRKVSQVAPTKLYKMHIQDLMQRTEMELQDKGLAVMFLDPKDESIDSSVRSAYAEIYQDGDFISKYRHILDSLSFVLSNQCFGIRFADYVAGIFNNFIRGYSDSTELFVSQIWPVVRKNPIGDPLGWGICEVPTHGNTRAEIRERLVAINVLPEIQGAEVLL